LSEILAVVGAIFGLVGLGYASARTGLLTASVGEGLADFVFKVGMPVLLFDTIVRADLHGLSPWRLWIAYFIPFGIVWTLGHLTIRRVFGRDARAGVVAGGAAAYSNNLLIGIPLTQTATGPEGAAFLIAIIAVHLPVMMVAAVALNEWALAADGIVDGRPSRSEAMKRIAVTLATHPILLAIVIGVLWRFFSLPVPDLAAAIIEPIARTAGPLGLFSSGMVLVSLGVARQVGPAAAIAAMKLLALPALVFAGASLVGLPPVGVAAVTLGAACPTGVNVFISANRLGTGQALASNALVMSTAGAAVTIGLWLAAIDAMLP
jgi:predicted permease